VDRPVTESPPRGHPIVDVGIPTLGTSPYLLESVESVMNQSLSSWRLVISENGPGVASLHRALEPYVRDPRIRHVVTGERVGRGQNHTNLIRAGSAPYVGVLHDDDRWGHRFLERRVEFLERHRTCGLVYSGHNVIDDSGVIIGRTKPYLPPGVHRSASILPLLYRKNFIGTPAVLVRRAAYAAVGSEYMEIINLDIEMWLRLAAQFDVGCLGGWDADYRIHGNQTSADRVGLAEQWFPVLDAAEHLPLSRSLRKSVRAEALVLAALDAVERGERRRSIGHLARAVRVHPSTLVRPEVGARVLAGLAALTTGRRGRTALTRIRDKRWKTGGADGLLGPDTASALPYPSGRSTRG
jgi:teichuronic acid biosynthesis glycosyltransferase TuaG